MVHLFHRWAFGGALAAGLIWLAPVHAQIYATNFDALPNGTSILVSTPANGQWSGISNLWSGSYYTNATATVSNGTYQYAGYTFSNYVIFQGDISNQFARITPDANHVASAQLLEQVVWSTALPDDSVCPYRQGGICFSNGDVYAWATNGWLLLTYTNGIAANYPSNTWALVTFVANYTGASFGPPTNTVFYQVRVNGTNLVPSSANRYAHGSPFYSTNNGLYIQSSALYNTASPGINGLFLGGSGGMDAVVVETEIPTNQPTPVPLSAGINIRAYQTADGVYVEFKTKGEEGSGDIELIVTDANGVQLFDGTQAAVGSGDHVYGFIVPGLVVGGTYNFEVIDEVGKGWAMPNVTVTAFAASMLRMSPVGVTLAFNTIPGRQYSVEFTPQLGGTWQSQTNFVATNSYSSVFVFFPDPNASSGFFRIVQQ